MIDQINPLLNFLNEINLLISNLNPQLLAIPQTLSIIRFSKIIQFRTKHI